MSYDEFIDHPHPKPKKRFVRIFKPKPNKHKFHVCVPLYKGIPKEVQTGWTRMGPRGVEEWNNTTDLTFWEEHHLIKDKNLYCGTCGRIMVKGRNLITPTDITKTIKLV